MININKNVTHSHPIGPQELQPLGTLQEKSMINGCKAIRQNIHVGDAVYSVTMKKSKLFWKKPKVEIHSLSSRRTESFSSKMQMEEIHSLAKKNRGKKIVVEKNINGSIYEVSMKKSRFPFGKTKVKLTELDKRHTVVAEGKTFTYNKGKLLEEKLQQMFDYFAVEGHLSKVLNKMATELRGHWQPGISKEIVLNQFHYKLSIMRPKKPLYPLQMEVACSIPKENRRWEKRYDVAWDLSNRDEILMQAKKDIARATKESEARIVAEILAKEILTQEILNKEIFQQTMASTPKATTSK
ncbi:MAG: hypothetical protein LBN94_00765 [Puniceicoccales bacterium]|jgi:hypothetical protein|nr:hypothetical protein [Puniceicoccales bacterium]